MSLVVEPSSVAGRGFVPPMGLGAFRTLTLVRIVTSELGRAVPVFPLAFLDDGGAAPLVAILGLEDGHNLFVSEDDRWLAGYVPAWIRRHPFCLRVDGDCKPRLALETGDETLGTGRGALPLFDEADNPTKFFHEMERFLNRLEDEQIVVDRATAQLNALGLLEPWPVRIQRVEQSGKLPDLLRVNESALLDLTDAEFLELRSIGALPLAFAQIFSMRNLSQLAWLQRVHTHGHAAKSAADADLIALLAADEHIFDFGEPLVDFARSETADLELDTRKNRLI